MRRLDAVSRRQETTVVAREDGVADLHVHTTASDGDSTLDERLAHAEAADLPVFAVTDHDCLHPALPAPVVEYDRALVISGAEIRASVDGREVEILGYFLDPETSSLQRVLDQIQRHRVDRNRAIVSALRAETALSATYESLADSVDGVLTRPHIAAQLVAEGVVKSRSAAFQQYLSAGAQTHEPLELVDHAAVIDAIHDAGGVASLAHPGYLCGSRGNGADTSLRATVETAAAAGLDALEVAYDYGSDGFTSTRATALASAFDLLSTGGSDCHGPASEASIGDVRISRSEFARLCRRADIAVETPKWSAALDRG